jgi:alkylation response protein AidB-like acyl-CoA dehydrogenase
MGKVLVTLRRLDFEFSDEQEELRATIRRFLAERAPISYVRSMLDDERGTTDDVWKGLVDLGVTGLLAPDEHGGAGIGMVAMAVVLEELGRALHPGPFASSAVGAVSLASLSGGAAVRPDLAAGTTIATVALYEPGRRSQWREPTTVARGHGDEWRVSGTKVHVADAAAADVLFATAATDPGLGAFAVRGGGDGVTVTSIPTVDGTRKEGTVTLEDAPATRLGDADATDAVAEVVDRMAVAAVVDGVGAASRVLELSIEYAKQRQQFDRPIGSFQAVQHLCADMLRAVELARAAAYYACWAIDAASPAERHRAATMAKAFAADELYSVGASAIQVHAGIGYTWEHDVHLFYKRLLTLQHEGGSSADHLEELAAIVLD